MTDSINKKQKMDIDNSGNNGVQLAIRDYDTNGTATPSNIPVIKRRIVSTDPPISGHGLRIGIYQGPLLCGDKKAIDFNVKQLSKWSKSCSVEKAQLLIVGELFLCGYNIRPNDRNEVSMIQSDVEDIIRPIAIENNIALLVPYAEKISNDTSTTTNIKMYDSMILIDKDGNTIHNYQKSQLWGDDEKKHWMAPYVENPNDAYQVFLLNGIRIGMINCYEAEFPELSRILALKGAQIILIPTAADLGTFNSETGAWSNWAYPDVALTIIPANAYHNKCFCTYINHSLYQFRSDGVTMSGIYLGNSTVADPMGQTMVIAENVETMLIVDCIPTDYPPCHPNGQSDFFRDRRPELFSQLTAMSHIRNDTGEVYHYPEDPNKE